MQYTWQLALVLVPVYFIKQSVSCYIYYTIYLLHNTDVDSSSLTSPSHRRDVGIVSSLSHWIFGNSSRMDNFSALELHAEIYYAEANLLLSFLTFIQVCMCLGACVLYWTRSSTNSSVICLYNTNPCVEIYQINIPYNGKFGGSFNLAILRIWPLIAKLKFSGGCAVVATPETPN